MRIGGLEKLTTLDYPGELAAIVFTYGCNMRCPYCHNPELVTSSLVKDREIDVKTIFQFLQKRIGTLSAVSITGGEPTIHQDLPDFIEDIKQLGYLVKLDTNGSNPKMVKQLIDMRLVDYWAVDVKYRKELYQQGFAGGSKIEGIAESIDLIVNSAVRYEFRTTVMKGLHDLKSINQIGKMIEGAENYFIQNFRPGKTIDPKLTKKNSFSQIELEEFEK